MSNYRTSFPIIDYGTHPKNKIKKLGKNFVLRQEVDQLLVLAFALLDDVILLKYLNAAKEISKWVSWGINSLRYLTTFQKHRYGTHYGTHLLQCEVLFV